MDSIGLVQAISRWLHLTLSPDALIDGIPLIWLGRLGTVLQMSGVLLLLMEVVGAANIEKWAHDRRERLKTNNLARIIEHIKATRRLQNYKSTHFKPRSRRDHSLSVSQQQNFKAEYERLAREVDEAFDRVNWIPVIFLSALMVLFAFTLHWFVSPHWIGPIMVALSLVVALFSFWVSSLAFLANSIFTFLGRFSLVKLTIGLFITIGSMLVLLAQTTDFHSRPPVVSPAVSIDDPACVGPFDPGTVEGDRVAQSLRVVAGQLAASAGSPIVRVWLVGSTDRRRLTGDTRNRFGSNRGLGLARARWVEINLRSLLPNLPNATLTYSGPDIELQTSAEMERNRYVRVYVIRGAGEERPQGTRADQSSCP